MPPKALSFGVLALAGSLLMSGCSTHAERAVAPPMTRLGVRAVLLETDGDSSMVVTVTNVTARWFVFDPSAREVGVYWQGTDGPRQPLVEDISDYKVRRVVPFDTVMLRPGASYRMVLPVHAPPKWPDRRRYLHEPGVVYAEVRPLDITSFDRTYWQQARRVRFLSEKMVSNRIATPLKVSSGSAHPEQRTP